MALRITEYSNSILHDISFSLEMGQNLVILGANGVGKSTLAKVLCGLIPSACVEIDGINPSQSNAIERAKVINYIPPKLEVFDSYLTVEALLALSHFDKTRTVDDALEMLHISHLHTHTCQSLSSGESQLVLTASALLHGADYTLFDEPTANLDPVRIKEIYNLLKANETLPSKLVITHNLDLAYKLGYDVLYLKEGRIAYHGSNEGFFSPESLQRHYGSSVAIVQDHLVVAL